MATFVRLAIRGVATLAVLSSQPWITGPAVLALTYGPKPFKDSIFRLISYQSILSAGTVLKTLKVFLAIGLYSKANSFLNSWATNNWRLARNAGWEWNQEVAVVTGGCSGIGKELVRGLTEKGVTVAILDIASLPEDLQKNSKVTLFPCDISSPEAVSSAAAKVQQSLGHPSILINNAGIGSFRSILESSEAQVRKTLEVNLLAHWFTTKQFLPDMVSKNKGHIVTVASLASFSATPMIVSYSASKAGALAFHEGLTSELKHVYHAPAVMTTCVHPAWTRTPLVEPYSELLEKRREKLMTVEQVATPILNQIFNCRGGQLLIPKHLSVITGLRGWPNWLQEALRDGASTKPAEALTPS